MRRTKELFDAGEQKEILTVDNHADGPYLYLKLKDENPARAKEVLELLRMNEGNSSGLGIGCVSWDGEVYADQFWRNKPLGNIRQRSFSEIWLDEKNELLSKLKNKKKYVKGRCAQCRWLDICAGNFRARAETAGEIWGPDPACYLTDKEISVKED
jgi:radical SAM protein with 4Fe4S-binding SPASM domain